jgi:DNA-binding transcriptional regulator YiaG
VAKKAKALGVRGTWKATNPDELLAFRSANRISRPRLARVLGVSLGSVQNWEHGTVPSIDMQRRLADVIREGASAFMTAAQSRGGRGPAPGAIGEDPVIATTGAIVAGYLQTLKEPMDEVGLMALIRSVRAALSYGYDAGRSSVSTARLSAARSTST